MVKFKLDLEDEKKLPKLSIQDLYEADLDDTNLLIEQSEKRKYNDELNTIFDTLNKKNLVKEEFDTTVTFDEARQRYELDSKVINTFIKNAEEDRKLKHTYASKLMNVFCIQLIMYNFIFILVGLKILHFESSTLNIFITGGVVEIIVIIKIIVSYLFKDNVTEALKNVLEKNKINK